MWWTAGHAKWPLPLSSTVYGVPVLFLPSGRQQASVDSGVSCGRFQQSAQTHLSRMRRSPTGVSDIASLHGRTGRLRRTVRNPLRSDRFLPHGKAACHLNATVANSGLTFERWSVSRSDGAYPRRERRGIAPVSHISSIHYLSTLFCFISSDPTVVETGCLNAYGSVGRNHLPCSVSCRMFPAIGLSLQTPTFTVPSFVTLYNYVIRHGSRPERGWNS
jgi:hypothetical protein